MTKPITFHTERLFRETPAVHFSDLSVPGENGLDLVIHHGAAVSPPNCEVHGDKKFYIHQHQTDNNRCIKGYRVFELVATEGQMEHDHYLVLLDDHIGALEILPRVYHRSTSCEDGSMLLNQAIRDDEYDEKLEFNPTAGCQDPKLQEVLDRNNPVYVNGTKEVIDYFLKNKKLPN